MPGLYIHIPFCVRKCHYCDFVITVRRQTSARRSFLELIGKEADLAFESYGAMSFCSVYFGGGSPSLLEGDEMKQLHDKLRCRFSFLPDAEITAEANPGDLDRVRMNAWKEAGINRVSLGIQSMNDELLDAIGRTHSAADSERTLAELHHTGFRNISVDIMIGLPGQTARDVDETLKRVLKYEVTHVSVYDLSVHEKTLFGLKRRRGDLNLPGETEHEAMFETVTSMLESAGFPSYEVTNYARPGFESRHNLLYWQGEDYLGLGPGAWSCLRGRRFMTAGDMGTYADKIARSDLEPAASDELSGEKRKMEYLMMGLRQREGIEESMLTGTDAVRSEVNRLEENGLLERSAGRIRLTRRGRFLAESIIEILTA